MTREMRRIIKLTELATGWRVESRLVLSHSLSKDNILAALISKTKIYQTVNILT